MECQEKKKFNTVFPYALIPENFPQNSIIRMIKVVLLLQIGIYVSSTKLSHINFICTNIGIYKNIYIAPSEHT